MAFVGTTTMAAPTTTIAGAYGGAYGGATYATAAPQYATGATYAAPPTTALPVQYIYADAAPAVGATYAAPAVTQVASYVAPAVAQVAQPVSLTQGIPDPATIKKQQDGYAKALEKQFQDGITAIGAEKELKKKMIAEQAAQQKAQYQLQVQSQLQGQNLLLDQQMNSQMMMLQESAMAQRSALEQQAAALTLEYQQKKCEEEMLQKQYEIQSQFYAAETKLAEQYQKVTQDEQAAMNALGTQQLKLQQQEVQQLGYSLPLGATI